jgi:hypothetical protein
MIFSAWLLARSDKADEAEIKRRFSYAEQALRPQF